MRVALTLEQCWHTVPGGVATYGIRLAAALAARDDLDVVGVAARHDEPAPAAWSPPIDVRQFRCRRPALYTLWHVSRRPRLEAAAGPVDVAHATITPVPGSEAPLVVTVHDLAPIAHPELFPTRAGHFARRGVAQARRHADAVVCVSETTRQACLEAGFAADRLFVTLNGVDAVAASPDDIATSRRAHRLERPYVLWTGTVEPRKNLPGLVEAWRRLRADGTAGDRQLVLVGPTGWSTDLDALVGEAADGRAGDGVDPVRALGFVPRVDLGPLYAGADAFCYPSLLEGFGLPVVEAMAQGTSVVTSSGTATAEVGGDAAVLVDPRDPDAIADGLRRVLGEGAAARSDRAARGRARAALYTWEACATATVEVYRSVLA